MNEASILLEILLGISAFVCVFLGVRHLRRSGIPSLLATYGMVYSFVSSVGILLVLLLHTTPDSTWAMTPNEGNYTNLLIGAILINAIISILILAAGGLRWSRGGTVRIPPMQLPPTVLDYGLLCAAIAAFTVFIFSARGRFAMENISVVAKMADYDLYYQVRGENIFVSVTNWDRYIFSIGLDVIAPMLALRALFALLTSKRSGWLLIYGVSVSIWAGFALLRLQKYPLVCVVLSNLLVVAMAKTGDMAEVGRLLNPLRSLKILVPTALVTSMVIAFVYKITGYEGNIAFEPIRRLFMVPAEVVVACFTVFPSQHSFIYYHTSRTLNAVLGGMQTPTYSTLYETVPLITGSSITGVSFNMNAGILGDGWAQFGFLGVAECALIFFGGLLFLDRTIVSRRPFVIIAPFLAFYFGDILAVHEIDIYAILTYKLLFPMVLWFFLMRGVKTPFPMPPGGRPPMPGPRGVRRPLGVRR